LSNTGLNQSLCQDGRTSWGVSKRHAPSIKTWKSWHLSSWTNTVLTWHTSPVNGFQKKDKTPNEDSNTVFYILQLIVFLASINLICLSMSSQSGSHAGSQLNQLLFVSTLKLKCKRYVKLKTVHFKSGHFYIWKHAPGLTTSTPSSFL